MTTTIAVIGLDPHKASNTIAVLEADETLVTRRRFDNTAEGMVAMLDAVAEHRGRMWAVEVANGIGRSIAQRLVALDEHVVDVPAKLATRVRSAAGDEGDDDVGGVAVEVLSPTIEDGRRSRVGVPRCELNGSGRV